LITDHLGAAKAIADALVERGELSGAEVDDIIAIALAREGLDDEKTRCKRWRAVEANAERLALNQTGMSRGASRADRRGGQRGSRWRERPTGMQLVGLSNAERDVARRCDQRGVPRKRSPALPVFETTIPDPLIVPPRK
jgi:hypothetical protein